MRLLIRLTVVAIVSCGLGAALWAVLQFFADADLDVTVPAAAGLATILGALGGFWAAASDNDDRSGAKSRTARDESTLKGVNKFFADRTGEWAFIRTKVGAAPARRKIGDAFVIYGMPGIGKSEFAQYAAHNLRAKLRRHARRAGLEMLSRQVELHGHEGLRSKAPSDILKELLNLDSIDARRSTMDEDQLIAEWRKHLHGKFLILVLNNATDESQVLPLLPGEPPYIVLVTSRSSLDGLTGAVRRRLEGLDEDGAVQLIRNAAAPAVPSARSDDREAIREIAELYDFHPMAITLAVSPFAKRPAVSFADMLVQLKTAGNELLDISEYAEQGTGRVARSFEFSYERLSDPAKKLLRGLGVVPVPSVNAPVSAALADLPIEEAQARLRELAGEALITEEADDLSYSVHDLIRRYARSLAARDDPAERAAAEQRLLRYYFGGLLYVDAMLTRQPPPPAIEPPIQIAAREFVDRPTAVAWARTELPNLLACATYLLENAQNTGGQKDKAWAVLFVSALSGLLRNEGRWWYRSIELQTQSIELSAGIDAPLARANALNERALLYRLTGQLPAAVGDLTQSIDYCREIGGISAETAEGHALNIYGVILDQLGDQVAGRQRLNSALAIYRRLHDTLGEANVLHDLGMAEFFAKDYEKAAQLIDQALKYYLAIDQPLGSAHAHSNLARVQRVLGRDEEAAKHLEAARKLYHVLGNQLGEISVSIQLGAVLRQYDRGQAEQTLRDAMALSVDLGSQLGQVNAFSELGDLYLAQGKRRAASAAWLRGLGIAREHDIGREESALAQKLATLGSPQGRRLRWPFNH